MDERNSRQQDFLSRDLNTALAKALLSKKIISKEMLQRAWSDCRRRREHLGQYLVQNKLVDPATIGRELREIKRRYLAHSRSSEKNSSSPPTNDTAAPRATRGRSKEPPSHSTGGKIAAVVLQEGSQFAQYTIIEEIARGGMGVVYKARENGSGRILALKVLLMGEQASEVDLARFFREAQTASALDHPNITKVYTMGEEAGYHYFTMDYIEGTTFETLLAEKLPLRTLVRILAKIARALHAAHRQDILHRDVKPSNILIDRQGEPYLTDFGLAKTTGGKKVTHTGAMLGTPFYMSPEQVGGNPRDIDFLSDVYALGVILYQCLTGGLPFEAETLLALYKKISIDAPIPPRQISKDVPRQLEYICLKAMEKDKKNRYRDALSVARDLEKYLAHKRDRKRSQYNRQQFRIWLRTHSRQVVWGVLALVFVGTLVLIGVSGTEEPVSTRERDEAFALYRQGDESLERRQWEKAIRFYQLALEIHPQSSRAHLGLGKVYVAQHSFARAEEQLLLALKYAEKDVSRVYFQLGRLYFDWSKWPKALEYIERAIQLDDKYPPLYRLRAEVLLRQGKNERARRDLRTATNLELELSAEEIAQTKELIERREYALALAKIDEMERKYEGILSIPLLKSEVFAHQEHWARALTAISQAIDIEAGAELYLKRAKIAFHADYPDQMYLDIQQARRRIAPSSPLNRELEKAEALYAMQREDYATAYRLYRTLLKKGSIGGNELLNCGQAALSLEKYRVAFDYFDQVLAREESRRQVALAHLYRGMGFFAVRKFPQAIADLTKASESKEAQAQRAWAHLAAAYLKMDQLDEARRCLEIATDKVVDKPFVDATWGEYYLRKQKPKKALLRLRESIRRVPWEGNYYFLYGQALFQLERFAEAEKNFKTALELNPNSLAPLIPLLNSQFDQGQMEKIYEILVSYNTYRFYSFMYGGVDDLFDDQYNVLKRRYRTLEEAGKKDSRDYRRFLRLLEKPQPQSLQEVAISALASSYDDPQLVAEIQQRLENSSGEGRNIWQKLSARLGDKRRQAAKEKMRRLIVHLLLGRDPKALEQLDRWGKKGEKLLQQLLQDPQEDMLMRFLACRTLLTLGSATAFRAVTRYSKTGRQLPVRIMCSVALEERNIPSAGGVLVSGLASPDPFLRALCTRHLRNLSYLQNMLKDDDERVRVYAAHNLLERIRSRKSPSRYAQLAAVSQRILARGCDSENPFVAIYSCSKLWPRDTFKTVTQAFDYPQKYIDTLAQGMQHPHPRMKRTAAARVGSYRLRSLAPHLLDLLEYPDEMVRFQALSALSWLNMHRSLFEKIAFDEDESLLLRSTVIPMLFKNSGMTIPKKIDQLLDEKDPRGGIFLISFVGSLGGAFGPMLIMPYMDHPHPKIRLAAIAGMIYNGSPQLIPTLEKSLDDSSPAIRRAAAATLTRIIAKYDAAQAKKRIYPKILRSGPEIRANAAIGYYFTLYYQVLQKALQNRLDPKLMRRYDPFVYGELFNFLYEHFYLTEIFRRLQESPDQAPHFIRYLNQAIALNPEARYFFERGLIYEHREKRAESIADLKKSIDLDPDNSLYYSHLARIFVENLDYRRALETTRKLHQFDPRCGRGWEYRAKALYGLQRIEEAKEAYLQAYYLAVDYSRQVEYLYKIGECLFALGDFHTALRQFVNIALERPKSKDLVLYIARSYAKLGKMSTAENYLRQKQSDISLAYDDVARHPELRALLSSSWIRSLKK